MSMRLLGHICGQEMLILLDSGSSATFLSSSVAAHVPGQVPMQYPMTVRVANGTQIKCHTHPAS
jgi:predicted aspartyl protease